MAAYASLLSLARSLHQILDLEHCIDPLHKEKIVSLHGNVNSIVTFLEDYSEKHRGTLDCVGNEIRNAAHEAQDFMDSYLCSVSRTNYDWSWSSSEANCGEVSLDQDLNMAFERINFIKEESMKIKNNDTAEGLRFITYSSPVDQSSTVKIPAKKMVVGFHDDLNAIKERLFEDSATLQIIPIVGMGGIGKTTLARRAYDDSLLAQYFDICAWTTVSQAYQRREVLLELLQCFMKQEDEQSNASDGQLAKLVYQNLIGRRYLIVIDDMWSTKAWDDLKMIFPDDGGRSRILLTTRLLDVAIHAGSSGTLLHQMNFLNEDQSWKLFKEMIFGQEACPLQLVEIGKKIARKSGGLPLTIVVVAGLLLSTGNIMKQELWENILENISSTEPTIAQHCSKILCLSYDWLPLRLKPCFLYIAAFPEDSDINVSKLIKLWIAEGFLKPSDRSKCLEDIGEEYLESLVSRNLILVRNKGLDGKLETIGIHDLLRDICTTKAKEEGFLHCVSSKLNSQKIAVQNPYRYRRISIHFTKAFKEWQVQDSGIHSVLVFSESNLGSRLHLSCKRLSILDAPGVTLPNLTDDISTFVDLRYIAFALNDTSCPNGFPASISQHSNLQTIIAHGHYFEKLQVAYEIWSMPKFRHLMIMDTPFHLSYPSNGETIEESDLQTLETVINFRFTEETVKILVNLKKLKIVFTKRHKLDEICPENLFRLQNLEELHVSVRRPSLSRTWNHALPITLKNLTLRRVPFLWEYMTTIGLLPNLQVLEIMNVFTPHLQHWTPVEGQFLRLKYFHSSLDDLMKWEVEKEHFPSLESLILTRVRWINEIPCGIGEIDSLQLIELRQCMEPLVDSARLIQKQQHENGNTGFQVRVWSHW